MMKTKNHGRTARMAAAITALAVAGTSLAGCSPSSAVPAQAPTTLTISSMLDNASFDPADLENGHRVSFWTPLYDTMLVLTPDNTVEPGMAESYEYDESRTVLTLTLRDDLAFSDGSALTAADVKANMEHHQQGTGQNNFMLRSAEISTPDERTVVLTLPAPDPALLVYLTMVAGVVAKPDGLGTDAGKDNPVAAGPYVLDTQRTQRGATYTYVRNEHYWAPEDFPFEEVVVKPIPEETARLNALRSGQISGMAGTPQTVGEAEKSGLTVKSKPGDRVGLQIVDRAGALVPALADKRVRQAINHAIDSEGLLRSVQQGYGTRSAELFNVESVAHKAEFAEAYPYDPERARALLTEAGYADGFDITVPQNDTDNTATLVGQQLGEVGIRVTYRQEPTSNYVAEVQTGRYAMFSNRLGTGDPWWDIQKHIPTASPWNVFETVDPELDSLIEAARDAATPEAYESRLHDVNAWLIDEAWFAPFFQADRLYYTTANIDFDAHPQNIVPYLRDYRPAVGE